MASARREIVNQVANSSSWDGPSTSKPAEMRPREWKWIKWVKHEPGWVKLNTDGTAKGNPGLVGAVGIIRDESVR